MKRLVVAMVMICWAGSGRAEDAPAYKVELQPAPDLPSGKVATIKGTATPAGDKLFVEAIGVLQPVVVTVVARHRADHIKIVLGKQRWDEDLRHAATDDSGQVTLKLRTQGELRMTVSADHDADYWLVVWVGDEVKPDFPPALTPMDKVAAAGKSSNAVGIAIAVVLGVLILILIVWLKRKGGRS